MRKLECPNCRKRNNVEDVFCKSCNNHIFSLREYYLDKVDSIILM